MSIPQTVPFELFRALEEQLGQALQMIAALTLTDEEVISCKGLDNNNLLGWAESMKEDILTTKECGRKDLVDMLTRHEFLTNTHAGFIYGAFKGPQITANLAEQANLLKSIIHDYESRAGEEYDEFDNIESFFCSKLIEANVSEEHADYLIKLFSQKIAKAPRNRWKKLAF
jgi:hypothetical protein